VTKEEFMKRLDGIQKPLMKKYSAFFYYLASDVYNIGAMEKIVEAQGLTTKREHYSDSTQFYSKIFDAQGKQVGHIDNQGLPSIEFYKRLRKKYASLFIDDPQIIIPIEGVHRILGWHTVKGKMHCLAGGQTVLHCLPVEITDKMMTDFLTKSKLIDQVEKFKKNENEIFVENKIL
jgi:hypothetical protein